MSAYPLKVFFRKNQSLVVTIMAVGQGDASLFSLPSGQNILIDAGGNMFGHSDPGLSIILPTLRRLGVNNLDVLVISHPDPDHILGAFSLLEEMSVKEIWHSGFTPEHPLTKRLIDLALEKNISIKNTLDLPLTHLFGATTIQILAPKPEHNIPYQPHLSANNNSMVLRIIHDQTALLWPGDVELEGESMLLANAKDIRASILKAPHHGSKTSSSESFIDKVNPAFVIYSTGLRNRFNFPHEIVSERYKNRGIKSYNTAVDGEISISIANNHIKFHTYLPR